MFWGCHAGAVTLASPKLLVTVIERLPAVKSVFNGQNYPYFEIGDDDVTGASGTAQK